MKIQWLGHACFAIQLMSGTRIITDPFDESVGYPMPNLTANYVTVSHQHYDHNAVRTVPGNPKVVDQEGVQKLENIVFMGISTFHDSVEGKRGGKNLVFVIEAEGLRVCHLGDLGHILSTEQISAIGQVDLLFVPVGGNYTINADQAAKVVEQLTPKCIIPMHYKTDYINFPINSVGNFLKLYPAYERTDVFNVTAENLLQMPKVNVLELNQ